MISNIIRSIVKYLMRKIIKYISIIGIACLTLPRKSREKVKTFLS
ncbi:hypothetical protein N500_0219 [Wolbachia pipientis wUni]|nr:hypothetical protein N500_0219 [Wolbachia pipientis wUni]